MWREGKTKESNCSICFEEFQYGEKVKELKCGHSYRQGCIDKWLKSEKRCPVCNTRPL